MPGAQITLRIVEDRRLDLEADDRPPGVLVAGDPLDRLARRQGELELSGLDDERLAASSYGGRRPGSRPPARSGRGSRWWRPPCRRRASRPLDPPRPPPARTGRPARSSPRVGRTWSSGAGSSTGSCQRLMALAMAPLRALAIQPARSPLASNQTRLSRIRAPATARPSRSMIRPSIGGPPSTSFTSVSAGRSARKAPSVQPSPKPGAEATSQGKRAE